MTFEERSITYTHYLLCGAKMKTPNSSHKFVMGYNVENNNWRMLLNFFCSNNERHRLFWQVKIIETNIKYSRSQINGENSFVLEKKHLIDHPSKSYKIV